jgi:nucleoside-diphosphate-sugar epimerase
VSRYLVTGCAGFIGSHLVDRLLRQGDDVMGVDLFTDYYPRERKEANLAEAQTHPRFSFTEVDLVDASLEPLVADVDGVFHLAAQPGVRGSWGETFAVYVRDNIHVTQRLLEAAAKAKRRVVMASSSSVYGNAETYPTSEETQPRPVSPYGVTKMACELLARSYSESFGLEVVSLRYFTVYGPRQRPDMAFSRIISSLSSGSTFRLFGTGRQSRDFTYVDDAVEATLAAMENGSGSRVYNVGGGTEATLERVIGICERLSGRRLDVRYEPSALGDVRRTAAETSLVRSELGWTPRTSLEEGLAAQLAATETAGSEPAVNTVETGRATASKRRSEGR